MNTRNTLGFSLLVAAMSVMPMASARGDTATFAFENGMPTLASGQPVPFMQTVKGVSEAFRAEFTSPGGKDFWIQNQKEVGELPGFAGNMLWPVAETSRVMDIRFDRLMTEIWLNFATLDPKGEASTIVLLAYLDSVNGTQVGSVGTQGTMTEGFYPTGELTFKATGRPFDVVRVMIKSGNAAGIALDKITVREEACQADFDGDDATAPCLAVEDVFAFLNAWMDCELRADFNHDGVMTVEDVFSFLNAWFAGCP